MQRLEVSGAVRPLKRPLGVKWLSNELERSSNHTHTHKHTPTHTQASSSIDGGKLQNVRVTTDDVRAKYLTWDHARFTVTYQLQLYH
jgi:hypothetical protein